MAGASLWEAIGVLLRSFGMSRRPDPDVVTPAPESLAGGGWLREQVELARQQEKEASTGLRQRQLDVARAKAILEIKAVLRATIDPSALTQLKSSDRDHDMNFHFEVDGYQFAVQVAGTLPPFIFQCHIGRPRTQVHRLSDVTL